MTKLKIQIYEPPKKTPKNIRRLPHDPKYETSDEDSRDWRVAFFNGKVKK